MKKKLLGTCLIAMLTVFSSFAQNTNIGNLVSNNEWNTLFPKRAGTQPNHPQGYTTDFYSYQNFLNAAEEISDYVVTYRSAVFGATSVSVRRKSTGATYSFNISSASWSGGETTVDFGDFCNTGDSYNDQRELAAFFANITKETTGGSADVGSGSLNSHELFGLYFVNEVNQSNCYTNGSQADYSPVGGQCYSGRGPIQLSYYYNYGYFSEFLYNDGGSTLVNNPAALSSDGKLAFMSAIWFWMTPQCPKPSCHQAMHEIHDETAGNYSAAKMRKKGFLHTNNIINGGLECRSNSSFTFYSKVALRSDLYGYYLGVLGFSNAEVNLENTGDYSTTCWDNFNSTMQDYSTCAFRTVVSNCTQPDLGADQNYCSTPIVLDIGTTLASGDVVTWFANDQNTGQSGSTYTVNSAGTYRVQIVNGSCTRIDEVVIGQGGSIQATASNDGYFCDGVGPNDVTISVTGGGGTYNLYDVASGGSPIASGSDFTLDISDVAAATQKTFYVEEPAGEIVTIGFQDRPSDDVIESQGTTDRRTVFETKTNNVVLQSIQFALGKFDDNTDHTLVINVYEYGTDNVVATKSIDLVLNEIAWNGPLNTIPVNFDLPTAGKYELSTKGSVVFLYVKQGSFGVDNYYEDSFMDAPGVAQILGVSATGETAFYPNPFGHIHYGTFNWVFSTGSTSSCGRVAVPVYHDCTTSSDEIAVGSFNVFPNPAVDNMNISFSNINAASAAIEVYNSFGQLVVTELVNGVVDQAQFTIPTTDLNSGLYVVRVVAGNNTYNASVVVSK